MTEPGAAVTLSPPRSRVPECAGGRHDKDRGHSVQHDPADLPSLNQNREISDFVPSCLAKLTNLVEHLQAQA
jgi:hypothetical protein